MAVNKDGKYTKLDDKTLKSLEDAFAMDCPVIEACLKANISEPTYYAWIKKNPNLEKRFKQLRNKPYLIARKTIINSLDDPNYAFKYMEKKKQKEFGNSLSLEANITVNNEKKEKAKDAVQNYLKEQNGDTKYIEQ